MSRLDFCKYELVDDCYDWEHDNCDECNIFKAYCEGEIRAKNSIVRCKDCKWWNYGEDCVRHTEDTLGYTISTTAYDFCSYGERREP